MIITRAPCVTVERIVVMGKSRNAEGKVTRYEKDVLADSITALPGDEITVRYIVTADGELREVGEKDE